jgi:hypothetical protein
MSELTLLICPRDQRGASSGRGRLLWAALLWSNTSPSFLSRTRRKQLEAWPWWKCSPCWILFEDNRWFSRVPSDTVAAFLRRATSLGFVFFSCSSVMNLITSRSHPTNAGTFAMIWGTSCWRVALSATAFFNATPLWAKALHASAAPWTSRVLGVQNKTRQNHHASHFNVQFRTRCLWVLGLPWLGPCP